MTEWFTTSEVADALGISERATRKRARDEDWQSRRQHTPGRGQPRKEYHVSSLPQKAREALLQRELADNPHYRKGQLVAQQLKAASIFHEKNTDRAKARGLAVYQGLPDRTRERLEARLAILRAWDLYQEHSGLGITAGRERFCELYEAHALGLAASIYEAFETLSATTLYRWQKALQEDGLDGLIDDYGERSARRYRSVIERRPAMRDLVLGLIHEYGPHVNARVVREALRAEFGEEQVPHQRTIARFLEDWRSENKQLASYLDAPDQWRGKYLPAFGSMDDGVERPNQIWELDSTIADVTLRTEDGEARRYALVSCVDVYTRRARVLVTRTSKSVAIALLMRKAILAWGVPERVRVDNGKDYTSDHIETLTMSLDIDVQTCDPFHPEQKPFVERLYRTMQHGELELLPGYTGHDVAERQRLRERQRARKRQGKAPIGLGAVELAPEEFQAWLDEWCENQYGRREHSALGESPFDRARRWRGKVRRLQDARALDMLLLPVPRQKGRRVVQKKGIQIGTMADGSARYYVAPELGAYVGEEVLCLYDPYEAGRICVYGGSNVEFICWAEAPRTPEARREVAQRAKKASRLILSEDRKELREAAGRSAAKDAWMKIVAQRSEEAGKLHMMPKPGEVHSTRQIEEAARAAEAREEEKKPGRAENTPEEQEKIRELERWQREEEEARRRAAAEHQDKMQRLSAELEGSQEESFSRPQYFDNESARFAWCQDAINREHGGMLTEGDWAFLQRYAEQRIRTKLDAIVDPKKLELARQERLINQQKHASES